MGIIAQHNNYVNFGYKMGIMFEFGGLLDRKDKILVHRW